MLVTKLVWCLKNLLNGYENFPSPMPRWPVLATYPSYISPFFFFFFFLIYLWSRHWEISNKNSKSADVWFGLLCCQIGKLVTYSFVIISCFCHSELFGCRQYMLGRSWFPIRRLAMRCIFLAAFMSACHSCASSLFVRATVSSVDVWCYIICLRFFVRFPELPYALLTKTLAMESLARCRPI
jgi:hypothetical protein